MTAPQIIHESASQRQSLRIKIPAKIEIGGAVYSLRDLSVSGFAAEGVTTAYFPSQGIDAKLVIAFPGFSFQAELKAQVEYFNPKQKTLGAKFSSLTNDQISLLNTIIQSYMSGIVVSQNDLLAVVARDNFLKARREISNKKKSYSTLALRGVFALLVFTAGLAVSLFAVGNIYEKISTVRSVEANVGIDTIAVRATASGTFRPLLSEGIANVTQGQSLGVIETAGEKPLSISLTSPCDCLIVTRAEKGGVLAMTGEELFSLLPQDASPFIKAAIPAAQAQRLHMNGRARISIAGETGSFTGAIAQIAAQGDKSIVTVKPDAILPLQLSGRPAQIVFYLQ